VPELVYDQEDEQRRLALLLFPRYERMLTVLHRLVESAYPELDQAGYHLDDAAVRRQLALAAERVVLIDGATQRALSKALDSGPEAVAALYSGEHITARARRIAWNETAEAQRAAALDRYRATGLIRRVQIVETGDSDEPCASRHLTTVPVHSDPQLAHPGCRMRLIPAAEPNL
jgi:hypothetical protein